jgi:pimeloyl-ACP methyl ester carboxylesterase
VRHRRGIRCARATAQARRTHPGAARHGGRILPITATADRLPGLIADVRLVRVEGGPHNIGWTHPEEVNKALLEFVDQRDKKLAGS